VSIGAVAFNAAAKSGQNMACAATVSTVAAAAVAAPARTELDRYLRGWLRRGFICHHLSAVAARGGAGARSNLRGRKRLMDVKRGRAPQRL